jgi:hypothetical protein
MGLIGPRRVFLGVLDVVVGKSSTKPLAGRAAVGIEWLHPLHTSCAATTYLHTCLYLPGTYLDISLTGANQDFHCEE